MKSKRHLNLVPLREIPKWPAAQEKIGSVVDAGSPIDGEIVIFVGAVRYVAKIRGDEQFIHELRQATHRGHDPAEAAKWLLELAVRNLNPHHSNLGHRNTLRWEELFGKSR